MNAVNNNQPQATYTKAPSGGSVPSAPRTTNETSSANAAAGNTPPPNNNQKKSKVNLKMVLAIIGIILFLVVASVGVFISQRQQQVSGPVAPNVPSSRPSADEITSENCTIKFEVPAPEGVANCTSKEAFYVENGQEVEIDDSVVITRGSEFYFRATIAANELTAGGVSFYDELDPNFEYIEDERNSNNIAVEVEGDRTIIRATFPQMQANDQEEIVFKVRVKDDAEIGSYGNLAVVTTSGVSDNDSSCGVETPVQATGDAVCISKEAYRVTTGGEAGDRIGSGENVSPGEDFIYRINVSSEEHTPENVILNDLLPENILFDTINIATDSTTVNETDDGTMITTDLGVFGDGQSRSVDLYVQVADDATAGDLNNEAEILTGDGDEEASTCSLDLSIPATSCNSECTTDAQCPSTLFCSDEGRCRLESNPTNDQCEEEEEEEKEEEEPQCNDACSSNSDCPSDLFCSDEGRCRLASNPSNTQCKPPQQATPTPTPTPTPAPGCNDTCVTNADCSNTAHICHTTADGANVCRLAENVESTTCTAEQPVAPEELPKTGPEEWMTWLKTGLVTLGLGTILLLLL